MKRTIAIVLALTMLASVALAAGNHPDKQGFPKAVSGFGGIGLPQSQHMIWDFWGVNTLPLVEKDPSNNWEIVVNGAKGRVKGYFGRFISVMAHKLEERTDYTLIYYGDDTHNDYWPYATCILNGRTNHRGRLYMGGKYNYRHFLHNGVDEKIWLVLSSDVDCAAGKMTAWNPTEYLFETKTI